MYQLNQKILTPIGEGLYQGMYRAVLAPIEKVLVRMPVNEQTVPHLQDETCVTPRATKSALFAFPSNELGGNIIEDIIIIALVLLVVVLIGKALGWPW